MNCMATVDVLFPMVPDAADFGKIAVNHVLGDVYAAFGIPCFALSVLGVPYGLEPTSPEVIQMMVGSVHELSRAGTTLIGGHTLAKQADLSLGFCVIAQAMTDATEPLRGIKEGDPIFLTKPLGTSIASLLWKHAPQLEEEFADVRASMLETSLPAARLLYRHGVTVCTDVTGFGLINHLHRLLVRLDSAAEIFIDQLPGFATTEQYYGEDLPTTSLYFHNLNHAARFADINKASGHAKAALLFDAQVAGGLLFALPVEHVLRIQDEFKTSGLAMHLIGRCRKGTAGNVII